MNTDVAEIYYCEKNDGIEITCKGSLDLAIADQFDEAIKRAQKSGLPVTVDMLSALFIDTAILASLATIAADFYKRGEKLKVLLVEGSHPHYVLRIAGFDELMDLRIEKAPE